jgi:DNA-binding response OmpR family regulator
MALTNSILVISDNQENIANFRSKLILLRDIDNVIGAKIENAVESCKKYMPDAIIIFVHEKSSSYLDVCTTIRKDSVLKTTPILIIFSFFDEQYNLSCFDAGMSDYIILPAPDSEILMKVIWNLQKSEMAREIEKKRILLSDLGVMDRKNEAYTSEFLSKVFSNEINTAKIYKYSVVLAAICLDSNADKSKNDLLASIIKKSIRNTDILGIAGAGKYYIFMPRTEEKGGYAVYNRIKKYFKNNFSLSAGVCETKGSMDFESLSSCASSALNEAISRGGNRLIIFNNPADIDIKAKSPKEWLNKIQSGDKKPEDLKYVFAKTANTMISPVFETVKNELEKQNKGSLVVESFVTDTKCFFSIKDPVEGVERSLKIADFSSAGVFLDQFTKFGEKNENKHSIIEIKDLTEEYLQKILKKLSDEFTILH